MGHFLLLQLSAKCKTRPVSRAAEYFKQSITTSVLKTRYQ